MFSKVPVSQRAIVLHRAWACHALRNDPLSHWPGTPWVQTQPSSAPHPRLCGCVSLRHRTLLATHSQGWSLVVLRMHKQSLAPYGLCYDVISPTDTPVWSDSQWCCIVSYTISPQLQLCNQTCNDVGLCYTCCCWHAERQHRPHIGMLLRSVAAWH